MPNRIPSSFIDEVLARTDIVEVIDGRVPLRRAGKDYQACCPFHEERTPSFTVSSSKQFYHCFGCGAHGSAIGFLMQHERLSFPEAVADLAGRAGLTLPSVIEGAKQRGSEYAGLYEVLARAQHYYEQQLRAPAGRAAVEYLKKRGVSGAIAGAFGLGFAPEGWDQMHSLGVDAAIRDALHEAGLLIRRDGREYDRFRGRLMFPIADYRGRLVGFGGRVIGEGEPKYLNSPETPLFHKGRELYGLFRAREAVKRTSQVIVVEGYMDVIALAQFGIEHVVATLGTAMSTEQFERLFRFAPEIVLCFDGDRAGQAAAWRAVETLMPILREGRQVSFLFLPERDDPDSFVRREGAEVLRERLARPDPLPEFFLRTLSTKTDLNRLDGRAKLLELARPLLSKMSPGVLRTMMLAQLEERAGMPRLGLAREWRLTEETQASPARRPSGTTGRVTIVRIALALLVQHPELAARAGDLSVLQDSGRAGMSLLCLLIEHLRQEPAKNTAIVLERFKDSEHSHTLAALAIWQHPVLAQDVVAEFEGALRQLRQQAVRQRTEALLERSRTEAGLSSAERSELNELIEQRGRAAKDASGTTKPGVGK
ncbi:MAG: DNA primase [Acidiferrobacteraceae bacterium]